MPETEIRNTNPRIQLLTPQNWADYELLDSGGFEKLERFGSYVLARPEPQAVWDKSLPETDWQRADALFRKEKNNPDKGHWETKPGTSERWPMRYQTSDLNLTFKVALSAFKHVGIFPEQAVNWDYIVEQTRKLSTNGEPSGDLKILNLFAYTGGASLAAKTAGAEVTHVDAVKQVITWSRENMEASGLDNIRWMVEDAMKFVKREVRRGNRYQGIILDPPAYGRGPEGEKWLLEEQINEMLKLCRQLLDPERHFFILNVYSLGFSSLIVDNLVRGCFGEVQNPEFGELYLEDSFGKKLPLGVFLRFSSV